MNVPKEIADLAKTYEEAMETANKAYETVVGWLKENTAADGVYITGLFVTDDPDGEPQGDGEYCNQFAVGYCGDSFEGNYYHPIEGSDLYLGYSYEC